MTAAPSTCNWGDLLLAGGRVIDPASGHDGLAELLLRGGKISALLAPGTRAEGARLVDVAGCWVLPGLVDMHVHLREPGEEYKETIASGCRAAAAGGFTAVAAMPNTRPVNDSQAVTRFILEKAASAAARVYPVAAISCGLAGDRLAEFGELAAAGAVAVSDDGRPVADSRLMRRALEYAGDFGLLVISHAEDRFLSRGGVMHEGAVSTRLGLAGIPAAAETVAVYRDLALAALTGRPIHIAHVSTAESVDLVRRAKERGVRVTAETAPHYFSLSDAAVADYDTAAKMNPPLRTPADVEAIRMGLADGTLDAIATDHAPHSPLEKDIEFDLAAFGIIGLETAVPLTLQLVRDGLLTPRRAARLLSTAPARILGVGGGALSPGQPADITVIDPELAFVFDSSQIHSKSSNSPFLGRRLQGRAVLTLLGGRVSHAVEGRRLKGEGRRLKGEG